MGANSGIQRVRPIILVALGGFLGATLRYLVGVLAPGLPGTLLVNVLGSTVLGFLAYEAVRTDVLSEASRTVLGTGLLSSFTTYSTFAVETVQAAPVVGLLNVLASYSLGFGGVLAGRYVAQSMEVGP